MVGPGTKTTRESQTAAAASENNNYISGGKVCNQAKVSLCQKSRRLYSPVPGAAPWACGARTLNYIAQPLIEGNEVRNTNAKVRLHCAKNLINLSTSIQSKYEKILSTEVKVSLGRNQI